ncbi:hypothetical protein Hanom_Chr09g00796021 [Helianthus anomalus]
MYLERSRWEKHRERLATEAKLFERAQAEFAKEKEAFEQEKKSEEWGLQGLKRKLQGSEDTLAEERRKWLVACDRDNKQMFTARAEITSFKARVEELKKSDPDYKDRYEEAKSHGERVELSQQLISKDRDLVGKDVGISELQRHLHEAQESLEVAKQKNDSLEIDIVAENVAQENYAKVQLKVEPPITDFGWMQHFGVAHVSTVNSIMNATELDKAVAALTMAARAPGHRFGTRHCSASDGAEEGLIKAEENYDNLSLPIMDLVTEALKHEDYVVCLRSIFEPRKIVQLSDEEDETGDDGVE